MERSPFAEVRELRGELRHWRRSRANATLGQAISDAYIGIFAFLMLSSMLINALIGVSGLSDEHCTSTGCQAARGVMPWVVAGLGLVVIWSLARTFGPIQASPASASWLLDTPLDRGAVLRARVWAAFAIVAVAGAVVAGTAALLGGFGLPAAVGFATLVGAFAAAGVLLGVLGQPARANPLTAVTVVVLTAAWATLLALTLHRVPTVEAPADVPAWWWLAIVLCFGVVLVGVVSAAQLARRLRRRDLVRGGALVPGLGGALATLDLALTYDVLLAHRWRGRGTARPRRGGPSGSAALIWADLTRIRRSPVWLFLLALGVVVPYAVRTAGAERVVILAAAGTAFLALLPFLAGLRVLTRTAGVARQFPNGLGATRGAALVVPASLAGLFGLACVPAVHAGVEVLWSTAVLLGVAAGACGLAASVRWVTGRPPDYGRPLVASPAGAVPTNLYGSVLRGFDILLLTSAPFLIAPTQTGALFSLMIAFICLSYFAGRK
ncbi:DUF6297 family protein [Nocardioides sp. Bht2]|uniref:DUF6297 family protein n=1 Tax=Nocardioides sp. Bht2 TaxID=3392297 RepID=UPI0039B44FAC